MGKLSDRLTGEHRRCDEWFTQAENLVASGELEPATEAFSAFVSETERHFQREEAVLFPEFESQTGQTMGPTAVMRSEHEQMRRLFGEMAECLRQGDRSQFLGLSETLLILMQQHNAKEEQVLYPMSDQVLAAQADALLERFRDH